MSTTFPPSLAGRKILFATVSVDGHINPLTGLAKYLQAGGCDVRWYTSTHFADKFATLDIPFYPFKQTLEITPQTLNQLFPERKQMTDVGQRAIHDLMHVFVNRSEEYYGDIAEIHQSFPFDTLIADSYMPAIPLVKVGLGVPVVAVGVTPLTQDSVDLAPHGMGLPPATNDEQQAQYTQLHDFANGALKEAIDTYNAILTNHHVPHPAHTTPPTRRLMPSILVEQASVYLQIGTPGFEYERSDLTPNIRFVGALLPYVPNPDAHTPWFDERLTRYKHVVLVTQGTVDDDMDKLLVPTLKAFSGSADVLLIATTGGHDTATLRRQFPESNLIIEDYIPFVDVMPHADVYVTNGGYGGTLLGLRHRLPLVVAGVHELKNEVCARVGHFRYGIDLKTETPAPEAIHDAVQQVLADPTYQQRVARLADEFESMDSLRLSAGYIAEALAGVPT